MSDGRERGKESSKEGRRERERERERVCVCVCTREKEGERGGCRQSV